MVTFSESSHALYNFVQTINYMDENCITPFKLYIKNMLRNNSIDLNERVAMFLLAEEFLPIKEDFLWLEDEYILDSYILRDILHFESLVLFRELIPLFDTFTNEYPAIYKFNKNKLLERIVRCGYRGFIIK